MDGKIVARQMYCSVDQNERRCTEATVLKEASGWCKLGIEATENDRTIRDLKVLMKDL